MALEAGTRAPTFTLPDQQGLEAAFSDVTGKNVLLYVDPRAVKPRVELIGVT